MSTAALSESVSAGTHLDESSTALAPLLVAVWADNVGLAEVQGDQAAGRAAASRRALIVAAVIAADRYCRPSTHAVAVHSGAPLIRQVKRAARAI